MTDDMHHNMIIQPTWLKVRLFQLRDLTSILKIKAKMTTGKVVKYFPALIRWATLRVFW
uniref:Uncharacterized protein n=1 Tax=Amphimedon queenslandica TaxID=400682 RepID=A0A1X7V2D4_AMPQE